MFVRENQVTPFTTMRARPRTSSTVEENAGGKLAVQLYNSTLEGRLATNAVNVKCDGMLPHCGCGGTVVLGPGESITLTPYLYHQFYAGGGRRTDRRGLVGQRRCERQLFSLALPRFPEIVEDEATCFGGFALSTESREQGTEKALHQTWCNPRSADEPLGHPVLWFCKASKVALICFSVVWLATWR